MLRPYHGSFLGSVAALELSLNYCSHACSYCFANAKKRDRKTELTQTINLLTQYPERNTLAATFLKHKYPVLISNNVDPFAQSNYRQTLPLLEIMRSAGIPVEIQSRGGPGADKAIDMLLPTNWYVSICHQDDAVRKVVEPGAPTLSSRYKLIEKLIGLGWEVEVGINPYRPEWIPNPEKMLAELHSLGVRRVLIAPLHVSRDLQSELTEKEVGRIGLSVIESSRGKPFDATENQVAEINERARAIGFKTWRFLSTHETDYYDQVREKLPVTMPLFTDFVGHCHKTKKINQAFRIDEAIDFWCERLPPGEHVGMISYVGASDMKKAKLLKNRATFWDTIADANRLRAGKFRMEKCHAFGYVVDSDGNRLVDEDELPIPVWLGHPGRDNPRVPESEVVS